jgi:hypothetical protein
MQGRVWHARTHLERPVMLKLTGAMPQILERKNNPLVTCYVPRDLAGFMVRRECSMYSSLRFKGETVLYANCCIPNPRGFYTETRTVY